MRRSVERVVFFPDRIGISAMTAVRINGFGLLKSGSGLISYRELTSRYSGHERDAWRQDQSKKQQQNG